MRITLATKAEGVYGQPGSMRQGVLSEHMYMHDDQQAKLYRLPAGTYVVIFADGSTSKVLCSEVIAIHTEDGPSTGRCGGLVADGIACQGHAEEIRAWRSQTEEQTIAWERRIETGAR